MSFDILQLLELTMRNIQINVQVLMPKYLYE